MPIRFPCTNCGQRLSVGHHKIGAKVSCPKCRGVQIVPAETTPALDPTALPQLPPPDPNAIPTMTFDHPHVDEVAETVIDTSRFERGETIDFNRVGVPRYVVYMQGGLLLFTSLLAFLLGIAVGGGVSEGKGTAVARPVALAGVVNVVAANRRSPDMGALLVFLPQEATPDERISLRGLRPGDDLTAGERAKEMIRMTGGIAVRCDEKGFYRIQLPKRGSYYMLAISSQWQGRVRTELDAKSLAQIGKYFDLTDEPLANLKVQWRNEAIRGDAKINITFD